ncbi:BglG family transcription antiterminator [Pediococcus acidilactici]|uniref:BglG family transcription antiterminator n=1 Tax=Pediococcus acidilactici TaxID=1254 RepID=UPI000BEEE4DB|nr:PTS sugar transporter subunit IIA [Pediococcus acidilactici]MBW9300969.1 PRD domain-containing protein [Pediococcus acidilactici]MCQ0050325.1 PRD domain-containing protein [Pediococcus acidilactici]MCQ0052135.1 PRD domain-containing protein [Pediococcus acidilactici]MCQ0054184.1 PRD domain-containing protein [Pediococcus acidilactici]MCQ0060795.1 PRD domain-containing protein [Pediococcus acidilactici]
MHDREAEIVEFLIHHGVVHYEQIAKATKLSKRSIANYLDIIENDAQPFNLKLTRKPNVGIYLNGQLRNKQDFLAALKLHSGFTSKEARIRYLLTKLLDADRSYTLNELADDLYVSRSTLESDFKQIREFFNEHHVKIKRGANGIAIRASGEQRERLMAKILKTYWGQNISVIQDANGQIASTLKLPDYLLNFFPADLVQAVLAGITDFMVTSRLELTDYDLQSLAIHLIINTDDKVTNDVESLGPDLLPETSQLLNAIKKQRTINFSATGLQRVNRYLEVIVARQKNSYQASDVAQTEKQYYQFLLDKLAELEPDEVLLRDLAIHLATVVDRLKKGIVIDNPYTDEIKMNLPIAFDVAIQLGEAIETQYPVQLHDAELGYLALHFEAFFERCHLHAPIETVVVSSAGVGASQLLAQRLEERFNNSLKVTRILDLATVMKTNLAEKMVVSTIPIYGLKQPVILVSPLLPPEDIQQINHAIISLTKNNHSNSFFNLLDPQLIQIDSVKKSYVTVLEEIVGSLTKQNILVNNPKILEMLVEREKMASTALNAVAIPHIAPNYVQKSAIALWLVPQGVQWLGNTVYVVIFLALTREQVAASREVYQILNRMVENTAFCQQLAQVATASEAMEHIQKFIQKEGD